MMTLPAITVAAAATQLSARLGHNARVKSIAGATVGGWAMSVVATAGQLTVRLKRCKARINSVATTTRTLRAITVAATARQFTARLGHKTRVKSIAATTAMA